MKAKAKPQVAKAQVAKAKAKACEGLVRFKGGVQMVENTKE